MASKPLIWEFTLKDIVMSIGFVITIVSHYYSTIGAFDKYKAETDAKFEIINYRLGISEKNNNKQIYDHGSEAVIPQSPRVKRELNSIQTN